METKIKLSDTNLRVAKKNKGTKLNWMSDNSFNLK